MRRKKTKVFTSLVILIIVFFTLVFGYVRLVNPIIVSYSKAKVNALTEQAVNLAVSNVINATLNYDSIVNISYTNTGEISFINANQYIINTITREVVKNAQHQMLSLGEDGIKIPIGTFTGITLLSGRGPGVKLQIVPVGVVSSKYNSTFTSVGINNTLHQLYLEVVTKVELIMPLKNQVITTSQTVLLCEGIIIGKVPEVYFGENILDNSLDLKP